MFDDQSLPAAILKNPAAVQSKVLTNFENLLNGTITVADPNNSFNLLLEASASINAQTVRYMESQFESQYVVRATTSAQLYNHMSDFDFLQLVASPSGTTLNLTFDNDYLTANAVSYDDTFNRVVIPIGTQFFVGPLIFGIYYPINININKVNNNINVLWDTTTLSPLATLSTNIVPFVQFSTSGLNLITLTIPVAQFNLTTGLYQVVAQQGFIKNIAYTDQFYAARVFTNLPVGGTTELAITLSETVYDPTSPTAKINIQNDTNIVTVTIPQIYFTNGQIGNQVTVYLYTTKGAITLDLTSVELTKCNVSFNLTAPGVTAFSSILANPATIALTPADTVITGGSSSLTFTQLRNLIVNGGLYTGVPITPAELTTFAAKQGFALTKYIDNVTDRIYYASNTITGGQNGFIMVTMGTIALLPATIAQTSSILAFPSDDAITILPTTRYAYNSQTGLCTPLTDTQVTVLNQMTPAVLAATLNANTYTKCPFHIVTYTASQFPLSKSFNLMNPAVTTINFVSDNVLLTPQMSVVSATIIHNNNGTGGYTLRLGVTKTPAMIAIAESNITVYLATTDSDNNTLYGIATLTGTVSGLFIYELVIPTTYYLSQQDTFRSTMAIVGGSTTAIVDIPLASTFTVTFLLTPSLYPSVEQDVDLVNGIPTPYNQLLGISQQTLACVFGVDLTDQVYNITNATFASTLYATYPANVYATYPNDVYQVNAQGGLVYTIVSSETVSGNGPTPSVVDDITYYLNNYPILAPTGYLVALEDFVWGNYLELNKLHSAGDQILDANGNPIIQYAAGSIQLDANGNPIVITTEALQYYVKSIMFDLRLFYSQNTVDVAFVQNLTSTLQSYFNTIATIESSLLEQTQLYYVPNNTMGTATFSVGNNTPIVLDLGFSFNFVIYVTQATLTNETLLASITTDITTIVQQEMTNSVISLTDIANNAKTQLSDSVISIDVDGIDGNLALQTVIVPAGITTPIVGQQLIYDVDNNALSLQSNITISYRLAA